MDNRRSGAFLNYAEETLSNQPVETVSAIIEKAGGPESVHLVFVDIIRGFCDEGALASERVRKMVNPVRSLADSFLQHGLPSSNLLFLQDDHPVDAVEFAAFPPHCVRGSGEEETVAELRPLVSLPGAQVFHKNATNGLFGTNRDGEPFHTHLRRLFAEPVTFLVLGDCTDLCIYQNAMGIRLLANEDNAQVRVIVSRSHVQTYDLPVETARENGVLAHDGDLMDQVFLYHMLLNGIEVLGGIRED
ncbi:isochorismatase family protein [Desmospora profundinema]|uniref:Nicotinamidase-related amidase n=1 Tax=Desmospora profundinema TaxID=1571184 RepID=A0ABU1IJS9_9BACL|nr:isochorismatase family protein [Desmospora profundinema]MDR6225013.1 nicotinamidase-related amidase [Desmospora profundinema]